MTDAPDTRADHPAEIPAVLLVNLGTPKEPTAGAVRPYLRQFLTDRRVIETHPAIWRPILEGIILRVRPKASAEKYASVWMEEGSPLLVHTLHQRDALQAALGPDVDVRAAMRYGSPGIREVLDQIYADGRRKVLVVPLYPQYAASSAGTVLDEVYRWGLAARDQVALRTVRSFPVDPRYVEAVAGALTASWESTGRPDGTAGDRVILSFHGIPKAMHDAGDPYRLECEATASAVEARLNLAEGTVLTTFQSTFGPAEWLKPATIDTIAALPAQGTRRVDVICPGFVSDCLETLEEINILNREAFAGGGGEEFHYVPWGNDAPAWTSALTEIVREELAGWTAPGAAERRVAQRAEGEEPVRADVPLQPQGT